MPGKKGSERGGSSKASVTQHEESGVISNRNMYKIAESYEMQTRFGDSRNEGNLIPHARASTPPGEKLPDRHDNTSSFEQETRISTEPNSSEEDDMHIRPAPRTGTAATRVSYKTAHEDRIESFVSEAGPSHSGTMSITDSSSKKSKWEKPGGKRRSKTGTIHQNPVIASKSRTNNHGIAGEAPAAGASSRRTKDRRQPALGDDTTEGVDKGCRCTIL